MNLSTVIKDKISKENLPPGAEGSSQKTLQLIANLTRISFRTARPEVKLAAGNFWKKRGDGLSKDHGAVLASKILSGRDLLNLIKTEEFATIGARALMFDRFNEINDKASVAMEDPLFRSTFNGYLALRITQNELEEALFNCFGQRDWKQGWRTGNFGEEYGANIDVTDENRGEALANFLEAESLDALKAEGSRGSLTVAKAIIEALARTELEGSEAEVGKVGAEDRFWRQRAPDALKKIQALLGSSTYVHSPEVKGKSCSILFLKEEALKQIAENAVAKSPKEELNFDVLEMLGVLDLKAKKYGNDIKEFVMDSEAVAALYIYVTLRNLQTSEERWFIHSTGLMDIRERLRGRFVIKEYMEILNPKKFVKNLVKRRGVKF